MKTRAIRSKRINLINLLACVGLLLIPNIGQCFYNPSTGRWLSRDPIEEPGFVVLAGETLHDQVGFADGVNLFRFAGNNPINSIDLFGLLVLLEAHPVALGHNHTYVALVVNCNSSFWDDRRFNHSIGDGLLHYATLGAGSKHSLLVSDVDRPSDVDRSHRNYSAPVRAPKDVSDDEFIQMLFDADASYPDNLRYDAFPTGNTYNSNSYTCGLLWAVTGVMPPPPAGLSVPGFNHPVPAEYFGDDWWW